MPLKARFPLGIVLFLALSACEGGSPNLPTPPACTFMLSTTTVSVPAAGSTATVTVTTTSQCAWTASSDRDWITISGSAAGTGSGTVSASVAPNPGTSPRTGTLTVAGQAVTVTEAAQPACSVTLSSAGTTFGENADTGSFSVTTPSYCLWTAVSAAGWLTVTSAAAGQGNGTVGYAVQRNTGTTERSASIAVNEQRFTVTQDGHVEVSCDYAVTPVEFNPCMAVLLTMTATITTQSACTWTASAQPPWITITGGHSGTGSGLVSFRITENWDAPRQGIVEVRWPTVTAGQNLLIRQAGCQYGVSASAINQPVGGGAGNFEVVQQSDPYTCGGPTQNACLWSAIANVPWITVTTSMPRTGDDRVNFTVAPNTTGAPRTGAIMVRDKTVTITQAGL